MTTKQKVVAVLEYDGKQYTVTGEHTGAEDRGILYHWTDGNFGCDCNRSRLICDVLAGDFEYMDCGTTILLRSLTVDGRELLT